MCRHGRVAQSVERPSKAPVCYKSTDVGSNPGRGIEVRNNCRRNQEKRENLATPSVRIAEFRTRFEEEKKSYYVLLDTITANPAMNVNQIIL